MALTDAELETERLALLTEEHERQEAHERLHLTPDDRAGHAAHHERLNAHATRVRAFKDALQQRRADTPAVENVPRLPRVCPVCEWPSITPSRRNSYRCLRCAAVWIMGSAVSV